MPSWGSAFLGGRQERKEEVNQVAIDSTRAEIGSVKQGELTADNGMDADSFYPAKWKSTILRAGSIFWISTVI